MRLGWGLKRSVPRCREAIGLVVAQADVEAGVVPAVVGTWPSPQAHSCLVLGPRGHRTSLASAAQVGHSQALLAWCAHLHIHTNVFKSKLGVSFRNEIREC